MTNPQEITKFVESQKSLHLYPKIRRALTNVLSKLSDEEYKIATKNLIIMAMHLNAGGQVMHFPASKEKFVIIQLNIPNSLSVPAIEETIAHELGHVMQQRNWEDADGDSLEIDADNRRDRWGFFLTPEITAEFELFRDINDLANREDVKKYIEDL